MELVQLQAHIFACQNDLLLAMQSLDFPLDINEILWLNTCMKSSKEVLLTAEYLDEKLTGLLGRVDYHFGKFDERLDGIDFRSDKNIDRLNKITLQLASINERLDDHEQRIKKLEATR